MAILGPPLEARGPDVPWDRSTPTASVVADMSVLDNCVAMARVFNLPVTGDATLVGMQVRVGHHARGTIVALQDDAFERTWSWPRRIVRYVVRLDNGTVEPWVDARTLRLVPGYGREPT